MKSTHAIVGALTFVITAVAFSSSVRAATVTAALDPQEISLGDSAQLTITVSGSQDAPTLSSIDGLNINEVSKSFQSVYNNGALTSSVSIICQVTPQREGTFVIPAIHAGSAASSPITLRVGPGAAPDAVAAPAPALPPPGVAPSGNGPVVLPSAGATVTPDDASSGPTGRFGSIQVTLPKKEFYLGELVPVEVKLFIPDDVQVPGISLPQFTSDGLSLNSLGDKPERSTEILNGRAYTLFTWHSALTGVKTGDYSVNLKEPLTVIVPQQTSQPMDADDMFNNFFRNAMSHMGQKKEVTLENNRLTVKVLPLPQENRPADFTGAVGRFEVEASASPTSVATGDPITLRLKITGTGNFDRLSTDMLGGDAHWKTYSPKNHFEPSDSVGYSGVKTFEQPIIPNDSGITSVPAVSFSYFNPETRQYITRTAPSIAVTISGSAAVPTVISTPPTSPHALSTDLRPNKIEAGSLVSSLRPVYLNPWFVAGQGLPLLALLGGLAFVRIRHRAAHPERVRATALQQAIDRQIVAMDEAMQARRTDDFFFHARSALQQRLGYQWRMAPDAITLADVEARLDHGLETIRPVFEMADQARYSHLQFQDSDLRQWRDAIVSQLVENKG